MTSPEDSRLYLRDEYSTGSGNYLYELYLVIDVVSSNSDGRHK